jgi:hypothetical protein
MTYRKLHDERVLLQLDKANLLHLRGDVVLSHDIVT